MNWIDSLINVLCVVVSASGSVVFILLLSEWKKKR